eukprot:CAMPEP_0182867076 /NCGR_PEP_ID=MMETSP0034_2-20130328/8530_1 /TAXON_ID=156128 /ORGANISM="Nephroselmis pyriformis, Strain CCMP717" /LENGTH=105 /DNA_ID=CAMNT_0024999413 /DNA_START=304 /DNA_END=618 /DNA_ORIENTATION=-
MANVVQSSPCRVTASVSDMAGRAGPVSETVMGPPPARNTTLRIVTALVALVLIALGGLAASGVAPFDDSTESGLFTNAEESFHAVREIFHPVLPSVIAPPSPAPL